MTSAIAPVRRQMPAMTTAEASAVAERLDQVKFLMQVVHNMQDKLLIEKVDYGVIPGTGGKPTLLLPGMEKLMRALNAVPEFILTYVVRDYENGLFHFEYECRLKDVDTGRDIPGGRGIGMCTSHESSFRWRWVPEDRVPPLLVKSSLESRNGTTRASMMSIKKKDLAGKYGKSQDYWDRWDQAFANKTARLCSEADSFKTGDGRVMETWEMGSVEYRVPNPDIADQINTIMKRAKKRALGDAVKGGAGVSEYFTADVEDFYSGQDQWIIEGTALNLLPAGVATETPQESNIIPMTPPAGAKPAASKPAKPQQPPTITPPAAAPAPVAETLAPWHAEKSKVDTLVTFAMTDGYLEAGQKTADLLKLIGQKDFSSFATGKDAWNAIKTEGERLKAEAPSRAATPAVHLPAPVIEPEPADNTIYEVTITQATYNGRTITFDTLRDGKIIIWSREELADMLALGTEEQVMLGKGFAEKWQVKSWAGTAEQPGRYTFDALVLGYKKAGKGLKLVAARVDEIPF